MQAIAAWRPSSPGTADDVTLLWEAERVLHQCVTDETRGEDTELLLKGYFAWLRLLTASSTRALLLSEKEKNRGTFYIYFGLTVEQWKLFERDFKSIRSFGETRIPQETQALVGEYFSLFANEDGVNAPSQPQPPRLPVMETRAALMMLLISLVHCLISLLMSREKL
jgi:hypothetical protein